VTIARKAILCFLISVFLFVGFAFFALTGFWDLVENRFHNPASAESIIRETAQDAKILSGLLAGMQRRFSSSLEEPAVYRSFNPEQNAAAVFELSGIFGLMAESVPGLLSVRFIDAGGSRILFSTHFPDIIQVNETAIVYRSYKTIPFSLPFGDIDIPAQGQPKLILDKGNMEMVFSYPCYDIPGNYRGIAAFTVAAGTFRDALIAAGRMGSDKNIAFCPRPAGIIGGMPDIPIDGIYAAVVKIWTGGKVIVPFTVSGVNFLLVSVQLPVAGTDQGFLYGRIIDGTLLTFTKPQRVVILVSIFLTVFLLFFMLVNVRWKSIKGINTAGQAQTFGMMHPPPAEGGEAADSEGADFENPELLEEAEEIYAEPVEIIPVGTVHEAAEPECIPYGSSANSNTNFLFSMPFSFPHENPDVLPEMESVDCLEADNPEKVIFKRDGIPYISSDLFSGNLNPSDQKLNSDFARLVESVVGKPLPTPVSGQEDKP
jgi:hypothetical protein